MYCASPQRSDLIGLSGNHINMRNTTMLFRGSVSRGDRKLLGDIILPHGGEPTKSKRGTIGTVLTGATRTGDRLRAAKLTDASTCAFCKLAKEDMVHFACHCPAWEDIRSRYMLQPWPCEHPPPLYTEVCGISTEQAYLRDWRAYLVSMPRSAERTSLP
jgi:hypothetical protein